MRNEDRRNGVAIPATRRNLLFCKEGEKASVDLVCSRSPCIWKARRIIIIAWPATGDPGDPLPSPPVPGTVDSYLPHLQLGRDRDNDGGAILSHLLGLLRMRKPRLTMVMGINPTIAYFNNIIY